MSFVEDHDLVWDGDAGQSDAFMTSLLDAEAVDDLQARCQAMYFSTTLFIKGEGKRISLENLGVEGEYHEPERIVIPWPIDALEAAAAPLRTNYQKLLDMYRGFEAIRRLVVLWSSEDARLFPKSREEYVTELQETERDLHSLEEEIRGQYHHFQATKEKCEGSEEWGHWFGQDRR